MGQSNWIKSIPRVFSTRRNRKKHLKDNQLLPISVYLVAGKFSNAEIKNIMEYAESFNREVNFNA